MIRALGLVAALLLTGCASMLTPSDKTMDALSKSERSYCIVISSVYGTMRIAGSGIQGGSVTCTQEGFAVKSGTP